MYRDPFILVFFCLFQNPATSKSVEISGYVCGYVASVFYLCSRFPQLYKNVSDGLFALLWLHQLGVCICFSFFTFFSGLFVSSGAFSGASWKTVLIICQLVKTRDCVFEEGGVICVFVSKWEPGIEDNGAVVLKKLPR